MAGPGAAASTNSALVDINSASATDLDNLPGVGKSRAEAIIKNRPYKGKDDLVNRHIIPPNVYNGIKDKIVARQG
jgi:DNA uptake protein ComE-like DNA-binding protein